MKDDGFYRALKCEGILSQEKKKGKKFIQQLCIESRISLVGPLAQGSNEIGDNRNESQFLKTVDSICFCGSVSFYVCPPFVSMFISNYQWVGLVLIYKLSYPVF